MRLRNDDAHVHCVVGVHILDKGYASISEFICKGFKQDIIPSIARLQITQRLAICTFLEQHLHHLHVASV